MVDEERLKEASRSTIVSRRRFVAGAAAGAGVLSAPALAQGRARVVVIGGGPAGATTAKYLKRDSPALDVTMVSGFDRYTTCFFSNMYLAGYWSLRSLNYGYESLQDRYGVRLAHDSATSIDRDRKTVALHTLGTLSYDRLVLAPGISFRFDEIEGYDPEAQAIMPHSYQAGYQTFLLRERLRTMRKGGVFLIAVPKGPYRAGTAPYERASMIAHYFKRTNPRARILILDAKDKFGNQDRFLNLWSTLYGDMIEWIPGASNGGGIAAVDAAAMTVRSRDGASVSVDAACVIPSQRAGKIVLDAGLADADGWAPVNAVDMRSTLDPNVFVLGDSARATPMPKSAFSANSHAHRCAAVIRSELDDFNLLPARYRAVAWAYVGPTKAIKSGATYHAKDGEFVRVSGFASQPSENDATLQASALEGVSWYAGVTADIFS